MDPNVLRDLARDVSRAAGADRRLDLRIHAAVHRDTLAYETALCLAGDPALPASCIAHVCRELGVPAYTGSVDEIIPGERILCAGQAPGGGPWAAVQAWGMTPGAPSHRMGWGATDALARRAAALTALVDGCVEVGGRHGGERVMAIAAAGDEGPSAGQAAVQDTVPAGGGGGPKWSFEF